MCIPQPVMNECHLSMNSPIELEVVNGSIVVKPLDKHEYKLEDLLVECTPEKMSLSDEDKEWVKSS